MQMEAIKSASSSFIWILILVFRGGKGYFYIRAVLSRRDVSDTVINSLLVTVPDTLRRLSTVRI